MTFRSGRDHLLLALAVAACAAVYWPITRNYFMADDFVSLQSIANDSLGRWLLQPASGHVLVIRNALFSLCHRLFGTWAAGYFWTVLLTHLVNVALLFAVARRLTGSARLACFGAALWGTSPTDEGSLGWYAVYGHVVVGTLVLVVLWRIACRRSESGALRPAEVARWCGLLLAAAASFGVGVGVALVFPAVVLLLFPRSRTPRSVRTMLLAFPPVVITLYAGLYALYTGLYSPAPAASLLTMIGLLSRWPSVVAMVLHLLAAGIAGLVGSFAFPAGAYPTPAELGAAGLYAAAFAGALIASPSAERRLLAALGLLALGAYAVVAAGRAGLYVLVPAVPAYGAGAPRYHYVGPIALTIALCVVLARLGELSALRPRARDASLAAAFAIGALLYARSGWRIDHHRGDREAAEQVVRSIRATIARTPPDRPVYIQNRPFPPAIVGAPYFAGWASVFTIFFPHGAGRPVYFVEDDSHVRAVARPGTPLAAILVPPAAG
ncbi:MAG TPA: hypothetical protein VKW76_12845 [Candidatus Binatia bacterium]|nr:hypothetical protein [Candidatus Binatia bacterium]